MSQLNLLKGCKERGKKKKKYEGRKIILKVWKDFCVGNEHHMGRAYVWLCVCVCTCLHMYFCVHKSQLLPKLLTHSWFLPIVTQHNYLHALIVLSTWLKSGALWKENFISLISNKPSSLSCLPKGSANAQQESKWESCSPHCCSGQCNYLAYTLRLININFPCVFAVHLRWKQWVLLLNQIRAVKWFPF